MLTYSLQNQKFIIGTWSTVLDFLLDDESQKLMQKSPSKIILPCSLHDLSLRRKNLELSAKYKQVDYCTTDSTFLTWFFSWRYKINLDRIYGPSLMTRILEIESTMLFKKRHCFLSPNQRVNTALRQILASQYQNLSPTCFSLSKAKYNVLQKIIQTNPDFVWLGVGSPKQIELAIYLKKHLSGVKIFCVGAAFEFVTKQKKQAPHFLQLFGLEWLFRLVMEPKRLWRRYLIEIPKFLYFVLLRHLFDSFLFLVRQKKL